HRVDLVDYWSVVGEEEVHPGQALAIDCLERPDRQATHRVAHVVVDLGGHVEFGGVVEVFGREVVEGVFAAAHPGHSDLSDGAGLHCAVREFEHAAFQFTADNSGLHNHLRIVLTRLGNGRGQLIPA